MIPRGNELAEEIPMTGRQLRMRSIGPVFGNHLLLIREIRGEIDQLSRLAGVFVRSIQRRPEARRERQKLIGRGHRKGSDFVPLSSNKYLRDHSGPVEVGKWLPPIWILDSRNVTDRHGARQVDGVIAGVIRIRNAAGT